MEYKLAMSILDPKLNFTDVEEPLSATVSHGIYDDIIKSPSTMKRLQAYLNRSGHHYLISDLRLPLAYLYFQEKFPVTLTYLEACVLLIMGLQNQDDSYAGKVMDLDRPTILCLLRKAITKFYKHLNLVSTKQFSATLPPIKEIDLQPHTVSVDEDLDEAAKKVKDHYIAKSDGPLNPDFLQKYAIADKDVDFESALQIGAGKLPPGGIISVKSSKTKVEKHRKPEGKSDKKRKDRESSSKSPKKKRTA